MVQSLAAFFIFDVSEFNISVSLAVLLYAVSPHHLTGLNMINQNVISFHSGNFSLHTAPSAVEMKPRMMWPGVSHLCAKLHDERKIISVHPPAPDRFRKLRL